MLIVDGFSAQVYPASQGFQATNFVGYNGIAPGPTFKIPRGRETAVRFINNNNRSSAIHLHGSFSRAAWDGWADDLVPPGYNKMYYYVRALCCSRSIRLLTLLDSRTAFGSCDCAAC